jgi:cell division protein FtsB
MDDSILAVCDSLIAQMQQLRRQIQGLMKENADLRSRRLSLEAQVMEMAEESRWWENVILLVDQDEDTV